MSNTAFPIFSANVANTKTNQVLDQNANKWATSTRGKEILNIIFASVNAAIANEEFVTNIPFDFPDRPTICSHTKEGFDELVYLRHTLERKLGYKTRFIYMHKQLNEDFEDEGVIAILKTIELDWSLNDEDDKTEDE